MIARMVLKEPDYIHPTLKRDIKTYVRDYNLSGTGHADRTNISRIYCWGGRYIKTRNGKKRNQN